MKITNEAKVGLLTIVSVTALILGLSFLRSKELFDHGFYLNAVVTDAKQLVVSNPVNVRGFQIGKVHKIQEGSPSLKNVIITMVLDKPFNIPQNSTATISPNPLGASSLEIELGNSIAMLQNNDTLITKETAGLLTLFSKKIDPLIEQASLAINSISSLVNSVNALVNLKTRNDFQNTIFNLSQSTAHIEATTKSVQMLMNNESSPFLKIIKNVEQLTNSLARNNTHIDTIMSNLSVSTGKLAKADIESAFKSLASATAYLDSIVYKVNHKEGSLGLLINDPVLYQNLVGTTRSMHTLLDDFRVHPKRYVSISVFGGGKKLPPPPPHGAFNRYNGYYP